MSNYSIEKLPGEPIVLGTTHESWQAELDIPLWAEELYQVLDEQDAPVLYIGNLLAGRPWSLDELIRTANAVARGQKAVFHHPKLTEAVIVTSQMLLNVGALGMRSEIFGMVPVKVFTTLEEALIYARTSG